MLLLGHAMQQRVKKLKTIHLFNPLLHDLFIFSSVFWDIALDRVLLSTDS